jgi:hypothetical protein
VKLCPGLTETAAGEKEVELAKLVIGIEIQRSASSDMSIFFINVD